MRLVCDAYGLTQRPRLVEKILWWQDRCWRGIDAGVRAGDPAARRRSGGPPAARRRSHRRRPRRLPVDRRLSAAVGRPARRFRRDRLARRRARVCAL